MKRLGAVAASLTAALALGFGAIAWADHVAALGLLFVAVAGRAGTRD